VPSGHQTYILDVGGYRLLDLPLIELEFLTYPGVGKVEVVSEDERCVVVKTVFKEVSSPEDAASIALVIATQVADRLAFQYEISLCDPVRGEANLIDQNQSSIAHAIFSGRGSLTAAGHFTNKVSQADVPQLKPILANDEPNKGDYYSLFRWVLRQDDPVARFMYLYRILLSLQGGANHTQKSVDAFITSQEPGVQTVFNVRLNRNETIYTRLRNEVGHEIGGTTLAITRQGMEQRIGKLVNHVKAAISLIQ
jgi:hypothetical protein